MTIQRGDKEHISVPFQPGHPVVLVAHPSADLYGSDRVLLESVEGLLATGARVIVTVPSEGPLVAELTGRGATVTVCSTPVLRKSMLTAGGLISLARQGIMSVNRSLRLLRTCRPNVVYVNTVTIPLWPVIARLSGHRVVTHVHEAEGKAHPLIRKTLAVPLLFATTIIANSHYSSSVLAASLKLLKGRAKVVYNGVPGPAVVTTPRASLDGGVRLLYIGRLSHRKGVDVAITALAELRRRGALARLDVVGDVFSGNESFATELRETVSARGLDDWVRWHGFQTNVWSFLSEADIVLVPSRFDEPFGNTAVEAVLAGRVLVASETSGLREAAAGYSCAQFVPPSDPIALADAVERVMNSWSRWSNSAYLDAPRAAAAHDPKRYQQQIIQQVLLTGDAEAATAAWTEPAP